MTKIHDETEAGRLAAVREKVSDTTHAALDTAHDAIAGARDAVDTAYTTVADKAGTALASARDAANDAYASARDKAGSATRAAGDGIDANPLVALVGGVAVGLIAGVLLPRTQKEAELLGPLGAKLADAAREATAAAKQAGLASFDEAGLNRDAIRGQVDKLLDGATKAASAAGGAATAAVRKN